MGKNSFLKKHRTYFIGFIIWMLAIFSIVFFREILRAPPRDLNTQMKNLDEKIAFAENQSLSVQEKIRKHEFGLIKLSDGNFHTIGSGYENIEAALAENEQIIREDIDNSIIVPPDVELLIRKDEVSQIRSILNNAQLRLLADSKGAIVLKFQGNYSFIADNIAYKEYIQKYGTECPNCPKK